MDEEDGVVDAVRSSRLSLLRRLASEVRRRSFRTFKRAVYVQSCVLKPD